MMHPSNPPQSGTSSRDGEAVPPLLVSNPERHALAVAETAAAPAAEPAERRAFVPPVPTRTTTVLPRIEGNGSEVRLISEDKIRYEPVKLLGTGGMGEVVLVQDRDISRPVALKRLRTKLHDPSLLARFVDEIRTVGRLEHPNIVPIHDVGIDDLGRYFFVMKYVEGETLESIITKLAAGDPAYHRKYSFERRIEIILGLLHALAYTHANGVVHRDIKPANIMVGRYGEVMLMDWGVAKPIGTGRDPAAGAVGELVGSDTDDENARAYATQLGALIGTPAYMSPEQARGENDRIDARSDLYSATVVFHELMSLRHYLGSGGSVHTMIASIATDDPPSMLDLLSLEHPSQRMPPVELLHFAAKGLAKDPAQRFGSAEEMIAELQDILEGRVRVLCHITFTKRTFRELARFVDTRPQLAFMSLLGLIVAVVVALVQIVWMAVA